MANELGFPHFRARFESALQAYHKTTNVALAEHPLAVGLQNCHSVESVTAFLKHESQAFSDLSSSDRIIDLMESIVSILSALSATTPLGDAVGLVSQNTLIGSFISLTVFFSATPTCKSYTCWNRHPLCCMDHSLFHVGIFVTFR